MPRPSRCCAKLSERTIRRIMWRGLNSALWRTALGKMDDSIAAYRKSVAAKPDVFESNLNLGLQLAKSGQPDAEQFLRAATQLKPTSHVAEGQARAWLSLAHVLEARSRMKRSRPIGRRRRCSRKIRSRIWRRDCCWKSKTNSPTPSRNTKQALALDPSSRCGDWAGQHLHARTPLARGRSRAAETGGGASRPGAMHAFSWGECWRPRASTMTRSPNCRPGRSWLRRIYRCSAIWPICTPCAKKYDLGRGGLSRAAGRASERRRSSSESGQGSARAKKIRGGAEGISGGGETQAGSGDAYGDLAFAASENKDYPLASRLWMHGRSFCRRGRSPISCGLRPTTISGSQEGGG